MSTELIEELSGSRVTGQVKWFNIKAGYGFITLCDGEHSGKDIFVHYSSLNVINSQYKYLVQGEYVEFNLVKLDGEKYEYHAVEVKGIKGGPIMCETRLQALETRPEIEPRQKSYPNRRPREQREPRESREPRDQRVVKRTSNKDETINLMSNNDPGFEKVVKKRQLKPKSV